MEEALGYKEKKKSIAAKYLQKFIDRIDKFSAKKPVLKKVNEATKVKDEGGSIHSVNHDGKHVGNIFAPMRKGSPWVAHSKHYHMKQNHKSKKAAAEWLVGIHKTAVEETLTELSSDSLNRYVDKAKKTGSKLDLSPYGKRARGIYLAKKKIVKKEKINELTTVKMWKYLDKASQDKSKDRRKGIQKAMWKIANAPTPKYKEETQNEGAYDFAPPKVTILSQTKHLASKSHKCGVCHDEIPKGEVHHRIVYKDHNNGDAFKSYRYHGKCTNVKENAPVNSMGASSATSGPVQTYDPLLQRKKMLKRIKSLWKKQ